ncbi:Solute carrier family 22 member 6 [Chionoecetes opilio]|uniref:Solute carrier family 22 member 6 n=1 Tax=Chionoecetes opilio TaxID=41210 RepID=A0A8J4YPQ8_CHIOP|nr:Solute carrier family 22 member 6 [Chionoecetes opilio]
MDTLLLHDASCGYLVQNLTTGRMEEFPCTKWDFDTSTFSSTVTSEFSLVCERRYLRVVHQSIFMSGVMVGTLFSGFLVDRYGRLRMIAISITSYTVLALSSPWLPSLEFLLAFRFLLGIMQPSSLTTGYILGKQYELHLRLVNISG